MYNLSIQRKCPVFVKEKRIFEKEEALLSLFYPGAAKRKREYEKPRTTVRG